MDTMECLVWILGVILAVIFLILVGTKIQNSRLTQELCNRQQYDFCEQVVEYKIKK